MKGMVLVKRIHEFLFQRFTILLSLLFFIGCAVTGSLLSVPNNYMENPFEMEISRPAYKQLPITLEIDDSVPSEAYRSISLAANNWNNLFNGVTFFVLKRGQGRRAPIIDGSSRIHWITQDWEFLKRFIAMTRWSNAGGYRVESDVYINGESYQFALSNSPPNTYDLTSLLIHEFGHVLGLQHSSHTVMDEIFRISDTFQFIDNRTRKKVACLYGELTIELKNECSKTDFLANIFIFDR